MPRFSQMQLLGAIGLLVVLAFIITIIGDLNKTSHLLKNLHLTSVLAVIILGLVDHFVRVWRWELLLKRVSEKEIKWNTAFLLYSTGSLFVFTPGRAGEIVKSFFAKKYIGVPMATSLPIIVAERICDVVVMGALASLGLIFVGGAINLWILGVVIVSTTVLCTIGFSFSKRLARLLGRWVSLTARLAGFLSLANQSFRVLTSAKTLGITLSLGLAAWLVEVLVYFLSLSAVGISLYPDLFVIALVVFPLASLGGSLSFLPGGLGVTEGGLVGLGVLLAGLSPEEAILAALISRAAILGVMTLAGMFSFAILRSKVRLTRERCAVNNKVW